MLWMKPSRKIPPPFRCASILTPAFFHETQLVVANIESLLCRFHVNVHVHKAFFLLHSNVEVNNIENKDSLCLREEKLFYALYDIVSRKITRDEI